MKLKFKRFSLADWKLWKKFLLLGLLVLPMVGLPTYFYGVKTWAEIETTKREISGLATVSATIRLLRQVQQHGARSLVFLTGIDANPQPLEAIQAQVKILTDQLELEVERTQDGRIQGAWLEVKTQWPTITALVMAKSMDVEGSFADHGELSRKVIYLNELFLDFYKLSLDPDEQTALLIRNVFIESPAATEPMAKIQGLSAVLLMRAEMRIADPKTAPPVSATERAALAASIADAQGRVDQVGRGMIKTFQMFPALKEAEEQTARQKVRSANALADSARDEVLSTDKPTLRPMEFFEKAGKEIDGFYGWIEVASKALEVELNAKADRLSQRALYAGLEITMLFMLGGALGFFIVRNVTSTVRALQVAVDKVRSGDEKGLANITGNDEVGSLGRTVNTLLQDRIAGQKKAEEENAQLNKSVIELMQTVFQLSNRDLTAHANVDETVIGTVASSINQLTGETNKVLGQVSRIAGNVNRASAQVKAQAELVQKNAAHESAEVSHMVNDLTDAVTQMNLIATLAGDTNVAAESASQATDAALDRVKETVAGMEGIRETIAETEKRIKRLGERSQEISGIIGLINTIAERTHVLALNAAMQAAIAGDAGRGFAVVAEEVQRLAESSRNATSQIATLINNIQIETNETIGTVNRTISQVVDGSELAKRAGDQMRETQRISNNLSDLVQRIAAGTDAQNKVAMGLKTRISEIGRSSEQTSQQIGEQAMETAALAEAARQLNSAISVFKLPRQALESDTATLSVVPEPLPAAA